MKKKLSFLLVLTMVSMSALAQHWTGTWATAMQTMAEKDRIQTELTGHSVRQVLRTSIGGSQMRLQLSNAYSDGPMEIGSVYVAEVADSCDILPRTARYLTFNGKKSVTLKQGEELWSDALTFDVKPLQRLAVTVYVANSPHTPTIHRAPLTTTYIAKGETKAKRRFVSQYKAERWFTVATMEVMSEQPAIVAIGNSITDGARCHNDRYERWTDVMADSLISWGIPMGMLNLGIGANKVLDEARGEPLVRRFDRDALQQHGVSSVIILEGVNDIGNAPFGTSEDIARQLVDAYQELARKAHEKGLKVYIGTILPFKGRAKFDTHFHEAARQVVNDWIRQQQDYDGVIDFDAVLRDPADPARLQEQYQADWLHPNAAGYAVMGRMAAEFMKTLDIKH